MIKEIDHKLKFYYSTNPCMPVIGLVRSVLALGTFLTLVFNSASTLFFETRVIDKVELSLIDRLNIFRLFGFTENSYIIGQLISIILLAIVIIGWRPRITGIIHWWIVFSFVKTSSTIDGGDSIASILTFFLIPITLADSRKWHWGKARSRENGYVNMFLWSLIIVIRIQISFIYFHAGVDKLKIDEWINGTCIYYWFNNETFGASGLVRTIVAYVSTLPFFVTFFTWGTLILEVILSMAIFMERRNYNWRILLIFGLLFHLGIILIFGLISFFMTMAACLLIYLVPVSRFKEAKDLHRIFCIKMGFMKAIKLNIEPVH